MRIGRSTLNKKKDTVSLHIESFLNYLTKVDSDYANAFVNVNQRDKETQDILHEIELEDVLFEERAKLATKLRNVRKERRRNKDIVEETEALINWMKENKSAINKLREVLGTTRKQEKYHSNRTYKKRV